MPFDSTIKLWSFSKFNLNYERDFLIEDHTRIGGIEKMLEFIHPHFDESYVVPCLDCVGITIKTII